MIEENKNTLQTDLILSLPEKQQRFVHLYITGQYTVPKIAELIGVHRNTCFKWLKRSDVKCVIEDMQKTTHEVVNTQLKAMTLKAMERMRDLMDSPIDGVALQAVKDVLDRAGHKAKQEIKKTVEVKTYEQKLNDFIENSIDVEYEFIDDGGDVNDK